MKEKFIVLWRGEEIGHYSITSTDMWYTDGTWRPNESARALEFTSLVMKFDFKKVLKFPAEGTRVLLKSDPGKSDGINALVMGLSGNQLSLRHVYNKEAIELLIKRVN